MSTYLDKLQSEFSYQKYYWIAEEMSCKSTKDVTFPDFVTFLEENLYKDQHWAPQTSLFPFNIEDFHFIGKIENLNLDLSYVLKKIFGPHTQDNIVIREHNRQNSEKKIEMFYNEKLAKRIYSLYEEDFELIGYHKDIYSKTI